MVKSAIVFTPFTYIPQSHSPQKYSHLEAAGFR